MCTDQGKFCKFFSQIKGVLFVEKKKNSSVPNKKFSFFYYKLISKVHAEL